ncbi:hypothetical protein [Pseudomonas luteola]|uniref:hypothetical protein n=1 Tax=Pseudomonas luteola TaxID=47886 RepID=UPI00123B78DE|nr:hypothetical protein [Pseudomonas luteola]QEU28926.1 hypothetical protein FOB45_14530 [Pseudomonas luteola]
MAYDFVINDPQGRRILDGSRFSVRVIHRAIVNNTTGVYARGVIYNVPGSLGNNSMIWVQPNGGIIPPYRVTGNQVSMDMDAGQSVQIMAVSFG